MQVTYSDQRIEGAVKLSPGSTWSPGWDSLQARARGQPSTAASSGQPLRLSLSSFFFDTTDKFRNKLPKKTEKVIYKLEEFFGTWACNVKRMAKREREREGEPEVVLRRARCCAATWRSIPWQYNNVTAGQRSTKVEWKLRGAQEMIERNHNHFCGGTIEILVIGMGGTSWQL